MTDVALTARSVETPCTPLAAAFPTIDLAFVFPVHGTEMAKLGPERSPLLNSKFSRIALAAFRDPVRNALVLVRFGVNRWSQMGVEHLAH